ncbi:MAG: peptidoglycan DD-metalloendopeptidase family protein [Acidimicrobiia bacterium]
MRPARRLLAVALAGLLLVAAVGTAAGADTQGDLDAARQSLADARDAANQAASEFSEADQKLAATEQHIEQLGNQIAAGKAKAATLRDVARQRALFAYVHSNSNDLENLLDGSSAIDAIRRQQLLDHANQTDNDVVKQLAALTADLKQQEQELQKEEATQKAASAQADAKLKDLQSKQADVQQAVDQLQAKLDAEIAQAEAARKAELEKEKAALAAQQAVSNGGVGQIIANPVSGPFQCPVAGAAYSDDYGGPTGHPGIDMFVPTGTPAVAVKAGKLWFMPNDGAGGNEAYIDATDGNTYYYAHFSQYVGGERQVSQGEIIGLTGMTGNASAPHLHFEIRVGGPNGSRTDPYPSLKSAGC